MSHKFKNIQHTPASASGRQSEETCTELDEEACAETVVVVVDAVG
jgi:hypothetical protein